MILRLLYLSAVLISFETAVFAQAENSSLLYEISGGNLSHKSYVFGTIHLRDKRVFEQVHNKKDSLWHCFKTCGIVAGELKFDKKEVKDAMMQHVMMPEGITLETLLSADDYAKVKAYAKETIGWQALVIDRIKPLFTISLFTEALAKADYKYPLDLYLQEQGEKKKKEIVGIETIEEQMMALSSMSIKEQAKELVDFVNTPADGKAELEKMIQLYQERKLLDLYELIITSEMSDSMETALLTDRNKLMTYRIESMMLRKGTFVAIGAAHLPGDKGVLRLLQNKGYTIRAVGK
ncbi:MAG: hypothetical protein JWO58_2888 [Chitinophagaceae bacterium]|nr:hypothetical protein [Chitinophagaceae bacterium]